MKGAVLLLLAAALPLGLVVVFVARLVGAVAGVTS